MECEVCVKQLSNEFIQVGHNTLTPSGISAIPFAAVYCSFKCAGRDLWIMSKGIDKRLPGDLILTEILNLANNSESVRFEIKRLNGTIPMPIRTKREFLVILRAIYKDIDHFQHLSQKTIDYIKAAIDAISNKKSVKYPEGFDKSMIYLRSTFEQKIL